MTRAQWVVTRIRNGLIFSALATLLLACGGGGDAPAPTGATPAVTVAPTPTPPADPVTGVATPDSVAVVTATNAS